MKVDEVVDTPEPVADTAAAPDTPQDDSVSIEKDLIGYFGDSDEKDAEKEPEGQSDDPAEGKGDDEDDENIIRQRRDYLKHKQKLKEREKELEEREAKLRELESSSDPEQDPEDAHGDLGGDIGYVPFSVELDLDDFELETDRRMATAVHEVASEVEATRQAIAILAAHVQRIVGAEQNSRVQYLNNVIYGAQKTISEKFGIEVEPKDIGEALSVYGKRLMDRNKSGLSAELAVEAWARDNMELIQERSEGKGKRPPALTPSNGKRMEKKTITDDEAILRDFLGAT